MDFGGFFIDVMRVVIILGFMIKLSTLFFFWIGLGFWVGIVGRF